MESTGWDRRSVFKNSQEQRDESHVHVRWFVEQVLLGTFLENAGKGQHHIVTIHHILVIHRKRLQRHDLRLTPLSESNNLFILVMEYVVQKWFLCMKTRAGSGLEWRQKERPYHHSSLVRSIWMMCLHSSPRIALTWDSFVKTGNEYLVWWKERRSGKGCVKTRRVADSQNGRWKPMVKGREMWAFPVIVMPFLVLNASYLGMSEDPSLMEK